MIVTTSSTVKVAIHAAAPCPPEVKTAMFDWWGPVIYEYYASTEGSGATFINSEQALSHPGSVGRDGVMGIVHICDDAGARSSGRRDRYRVLGAGDFAVPVPQ